MKINASQITLVSVLVLAAGLLLLVLAGGGEDAAVHGDATSDDAFLEEVRELRGETPALAAQDAGTLPPVDADQEIVPVIEFATQELDLGLIPNSEITHRDLMITNRGKAPLVIRDIQTSCHCTEGHLEESKRTILPGDSVAVDVTLNPFRIAGFESNKVLSFYSNDPKTPVVTVKVHSNITPEFSIEPKEFNFGAVDRGDTPSVTVRVRQEIDKPFNILDVNTIGGNKSMTPFTDIALSQEKLPESEWQTPGKTEWNVTATLTPNIAPGEIMRYIFIVTDLPRVPNLPVKVLASVSSSVTIDPAFPRPLTLRKGQGAKEVLPGVATIHGEHPVDILSTDYNTDLLAVSPRNGEDVQTMHLDVRLAPHAKPGALQEEIRFVVRSAGKDREERIMVRAFVPNGYGS